MPLTSAASCLTSSEEFATEVVIPNYDESRVSSLGGRYGGAVIFAAEYGSQLVAVARETTFPTGLSVRIQQPTRTEEIRRPYVRIVSYSASIDARYNLAPYNRWETICDDRSCSFNKNTLALSYVQARPGEVAIEFSQGLPLCSAACTGSCIETATESRCVDANTQLELDALIRYAALGNNFHDLLDNYRSAGSEDITLTDIVPITSNPVEWSEALRQELVSLQAKGVITLSAQDIENIGSLGAKGQAGRNYRIVKDSETGAWTYYDQTSDAVLTSERDCNVYALSQAQESPEVIVNSFYLIPIIIVVSGLLLFGVLIIIARVVRSRAR